MSLPRTSFVRSSRRPALAMLSLLAALLVWPSRPAAACTTFLMTVGGKHYLGKSYDWDIGSGHVLLNKRGFAKRALLVEPGDTPAEWVSTHTSLTFNQYGREMPNGGINNAGLVVEIMWLQESVFPAADKRPSVNQMQWIQYQLDRFSSVAEVLAHVHELRPRAVYGKVHYLVCDRQGACAAIELLQGKLVVTSGAALEVKTLTNHSYAASLAALRRHAGFGGERPVPQGLGSLERFVRASQLARQPVRGDPVARAFAILDSVRSPSSTMWQIVYDLEGQRVFWRSRTSPAIKTVALFGHVAGCVTPVDWVDLDTPAKGDALARFRPWTVADNRRLLEQSLGKIKAELPPGTLEAAAAYPERLRCTVPTLK